jgi:hypothetical protein
MLLTRPHDVAVERDVPEHGVRDRRLDPRQDHGRTATTAEVEHPTRIGSRGSSGVSSSGGLSGDLLSLVVKGSALAFPGEGEGGAVAPYPVADSFINPGGAETDDATFAIEVWLK